MSAAQALYLLAVALYLVFFLLFLRFFLWKRYAERLYWGRRPALSIDSLRALAAATGRPLPFLSVLVPARNEADVIEKTIEHIGHLTYPADRFELLVITDEKEAQAADAARAAAVAAAATYLRARAEGEEVAFPGARAGGLIAGLLTRHALAAWEEVASEYGSGQGPQALRALAAPTRARLVRETAALLVAGRGRAPVHRVLTMLRRAMPEATEGAVAASYPALLAVAIPVAVALSHLQGRSERMRITRMVAQAARARAAVTRELIRAMSEALAADAIAGLDRVAADAGLARELAELDREVYPTTHDVVAEVRRRWAGRRDRPRLRHVDVPFDFDGRLGGQRTGRAVPSTKGRALNWGLAFVDDRAAWCGFYDAESRPHPEVLLYIAYRTLRGGVERPRILQGPVFQVRNFYEMGPFCKIAALYQSLAHDWYLPALFRRLPFIGGTNLFVERELLLRIGGYDERSLTEDLELGTRAYLAAGAWPEYLPYPSSEQTPPTFLAFYRQRLRWGTGHLQVMDKLRRHPDYPAPQRRAVLRQLFRKGQLEWCFYQAATLVPPAVIVGWWNGAVDPDALDGMVRWSLNFLSVAYLAFTVYAFFRYRGHLDPTSRPRGALAAVGVLGQLCLLPLAAFLFPVPYSSALLLRAVGRGPTEWHKTPRTRE